MKKGVTKWVVLFLAVNLGVPMLAHAGNILVPYVGTITDEGTLFDGEADFKVALCTESDTTLWSNDGTSTSCSEPTGSVGITLSDGVYSFMLGDTDLSMEAMASSIFGTSERIYLRTWFDGGSGFEQFEPDIEVGYSMRAGYADTLQGYSPTDFLLADDEITADNIADSAITASKISDGAVTTAKISSFSNSGKTFTLGNASDANVSLVANLGSTSPSIRYNTSSDAWEFSNDGSSFTAFGSGGGSGDITAVIAGSGLTGGATTGDATLAVSGVTSAMITNGTIVAADLDLSMTPTWVGSHTYSFSGSELMTITTDLNTTGDAAGLYISATPSSTNGTTTGLFIAQEDSSNTNGLDVAMEIANEDTDLALTKGLMFSSQGGAITTAIDASDTNVTTALSVGDNRILGTTLTLSGTSKVEATMPDNTAVAFELREGANTYMKVATTDSEEAVFIGTSTGTVPFLMPGQADAGSLGYTVAEWNRLYLGDDEGVYFGQDQDAHLYYDETTDDRMELTGTNASLYIEDKLDLGVHSQTVADGGGGPTSFTITPTSSYVDVTCNDTDGCIASISETGAKQGQILIISINTGTNNPVYFSDESNVTDLSLGFMAQARDTITFIYNGSEWNQIAASSNVGSFSEEPSGPITVAEVHHNMTFSNEGATAIVEFDLPALDASKKGLKYTFVVQDTDGIKVKPDVVNQILGLTDGLGDSISATSQGATLTLIAIDTTKWAVLGSYGTWTDIN